MTKSKKNSADYLTQGVGYSFIGCILVSFGGINWYESSQFQQKAVSAKGEVSSLLRSSDRRGRTIVYRPAVRYRLPSGETGEFISERGTNPPSYRVGDKVEILYDPNNRLDVRLKAEVRSPDKRIGLFKLGGMFLLIGGGLIVVKIYTPPQRRYSWLP